MQTPGTDEIFTTWISEMADIDASVVFLCGELDATSSPTFLSDIDSEVSRHRDIVLDVHLLSYVDSTGVAAILSIKNAIDSAGKRLCLVGCHGLMSKILDAMGVRQRLECYEDIEEASANLRA